MTLAASHNAPDCAGNDQFSANHHNHYAGAQIAATAADIDRIVQRLRESLDPKGDTVEDIPRFDTNLAYQLYSLILKPVEASWRPAKSLIMVTNGALGFLPIALLPTSPVAVRRTDEALLSFYFGSRKSFRVGGAELLPFSASSLHFPPG